jgi:N6-adenosine-specific RNA methylase IME4/ParB-like chromosome segregation protein Spo0J
MSGRHASSANGLETRPADGLRLHPQAGLVPAMSEAEFASLRADLAQRGILTPLEVTCEGVVLDGRARLRAARELGLEDVPVLVIAPEDEVQHMILAALQRRHLSASQRALLVLELHSYADLTGAGKKRSRANLRQNTEGATLPPRGKTRELLARLAGVGDRTLQDAALVQAHDEDLLARVKDGRLAVDLAARQIRRKLRDAALPDPPPLPNGPFELLYADPPWRLPGSPDSSRAVERHYPTMSLDEISRLAPPAAEDAYLFLWAVNCLLPEALAVMEAWGFRYRTNLAWVKTRWGLGTWARNRHELLLFGTRGNVQPPETCERPDSVIEARRGRHSAKPACVYELIERAYPFATKLELFARGTPRPGWATWGNEADAA